MECEIFSKASAGILAQRSKNTVFLQFLHLVDADINCILAGTFITKADLIFMVFLFLIRSQYLCSEGFD